MPLSPAARELLLRYIEQRLMIPRLRRPTRLSGREAEMDAACREFEACTRCRLAAERATIVYGAGDLDASLFLIGEAPGAEEDRQGLPFVGRSGELLTKMLAAIDIDRKDVFITNIVKCRPPGNRNPEPAEIEACRPLLVRQIEIVRPELIVTLGSFAAKTLLGLDVSISKLRGSIHAYQGVPCIPTFHPAYLLRSPSAKKEAWEDWKLIRKQLEAGRSNSR